MIADLGQFGAAFLDRRPRATVRATSNGVQRLVSPSFAEIEKAHQAQLQRKRERKHRYIDAACAWCQKPCKVRVRKGVPDRHCSRKCSFAFVTSQRVKIPRDHELLSRLYTIEQKSLGEIAALFNSTVSAVGWRLKDVGILERGPYQIPQRICIEKGCWAKTFKIKHATNGSFYGRRCHKHWKEHRETIHKTYYSNVLRGRDRLADRVEQQLVNGTRTTRLIAANMNVSVKTVANTLAHLHKAGRVRPVGCIRSKKSEAGSHRAAVWAVAA